METIESKIVIKTEPAEEFVNENDSSTPPWAPEEIHIKSEPFQEIEKEIKVKAEPVENYNTCAIDIEIETISVKHEPTSSQEANVIENDLLTVARKSRGAKKKVIHDEDYTPDRKKKKKKGKTDDNVKPTYRGKSKKEEAMMYSQDVTQNIEIVTINEEERQKEHKELLAARQHMRHKCDMCAVGFVVEDAYLMHMKVHAPESGANECDLCHSFLKTESMLYRHKLRHYRRYRCTICRTLHKDRDTAASHIMSQHTRKAFLCTMCNRKFKRPQYLQRHIDQHHTKALILECPECKRVFHEKGRYRSHVRTHNEEVRINTEYPTVTCEVCSRGFKNKSGLRRHVFSYHSDVVCTVCLTRFDDNDQLNAHYKQMHNDTFFSTGEECPHCSRVLVTRAMLQRHIQRMHSDRTKKYQCDYCQRLYLTKGEVRAHIMWSHSCARGGHGCARCGRVFRTPGRLRAHAARDHLRVPAPRDHACHLCHKAFGNKQVLKRHLRVHSDEMYPCNECGMLFKTEPYVQVHYKLKHLNMTRAQIKGQIQKRKAQSINLFKPTIAQLQNINSDTNTKLEVKINTEVNQQICAKMNSVLNSNNDTDIDPLSISETDQLEFQNTSQNVKTTGKRKNKTKNGVSEINTPLFETFVDIQRDIED